MTRRTHGRLRPLTAADRARRDVRNRRRGRERSQPIAPGQPLIAAARPKVDVDLVHDHRAVRSFLGRRLDSILRTQRHRDRKDAAAIEQLAQQITAPNRKAA